MPLRRLLLRARRWWRYGRRGVKPWLVPLLEYVREHPGEILTTTSQYRTPEQQRELLLRSNHVHSPHDGLLA